VQIADHQELDAPKGFVAPTKTAEYLIDGVQQVGPDHADFINDQEVEAADDVDLVSVEPVDQSLIRRPCRLTMSFQHLRPKGELKERMNGHTASIDSGHPCGSCDDHSFGVFGLEVVQERGFPCTGFAGQKQVGFRVSYKIAGQK